jgi:hypothetical protein
MIEYKLDNESNNDATAHLKDMDNVLKEISVTYQILLEVIAQQQSALSSPSIDKFRQDLHQSVQRAIDVAENINKNTATLVMISEQASKHLIALEDRFSEALDKQVINAVIR